MVLTLGFYLYDNNPLNKQNQVKFSELLYDYTGIKRTGASIGLRVANYQSIDPNYLGKGLTGGGQMVRFIWDEYVTNDPEMLRIRNTYSKFIKNNIFEK